MANNNAWRVLLSDKWDVLGPFPIHAREQHYLSPSFPLDLSNPIDFSKSWPSSYADGGNVSWTTLCTSPDGTLSVSFPNIRWKSLRATEGWAALQHHATLHTTLTIYPPPSRTEFIPHLQVNLIQGSFFTILPGDGQSCVPQWYSGNIYDMERTVPRTVSFSSPPSLTLPTTYDIVVSGDYEIRLFGDPTTQGTEIPIQKIRFIVEVEDPLLTGPLSHESSQDVICDFVQGYAFGNAIGIAIRSISGWWTITNAVVKNTNALSIKLQNSVSLAPSQMRIVPILLSQIVSFNEPELQIQIRMMSKEGSSKLLAITLPIKHLSLWSSSEYNSITATYLYSSSMPTAFLAVPPVHKSSHAPQPPILALHGAGVDILEQKFWVEALPRRQYNWIVIPTGRTSWGLDWHGPSAHDAWESIRALSSILDNNSQWKNWSFRPDSRVVTIGHSNGGQGALYLASRYPDKILGVIAAAGYIKSQAYVPLTMSRSAHYIDPFLRAILESSFTPDDNDLYLSNLINVPVLMIHGGDDKNVPVWHSREVVSIFDALQCDTKATLREDAGQGHWYPSVFDNKQVQDFLDSTLTNPHLPRPKEFTLTVSIPSESGSLYGWKVERVHLPGRLARLQVQTSDHCVVRVSTSNVLSFSLDRRLCHCTEVYIGDSLIRLSSDHDRTVSFRTVDQLSWELTSAKFEDLPAPSRMQAILMSPGTLVCIVSDTSPFQEMSLALRLSHDLLIYHKLDVQIMLESDALMMIESVDFPVGNIVYIGHPSSTFVGAILNKKETSFELSNSSLALGGHVLSGPSLAAVFLHPHPKVSQRKNSIMLLLLANSTSALERAGRLFPIRTGIATPSWVVTSHLADRFGAAGIRGAGVWTEGWACREASSMWLF